MREWKMQESKMREHIAVVENAGVENAGVDRKGGKYRSDKIWKAVRRKYSKVTDEIWMSWLSCLVLAKRKEQGHCGACRRKLRLTDTDLCPCGETQTMSHIVESCPLTKLNGGLSRRRYTIAP